MSIQMKGTYIISHPHYNLQRMNYWLIFQMGKLRFNKPDREDLGSAEH